MILPDLFFKAFGLHLSWQKIQSAAELAVQSQAVEAIETVIIYFLPLLTQTLRLPAMEARAEGTRPEARRSQG